jgi:hypothetical protein
MPLDILKKGDDVMAVSFADKLKVYSPEKKVDQLLKKFPKSLPIDEVYIRDFAKEKQKNDTTKEESTRPLTYYLALSFVAVLGFILMLLLLPWLLYRWYKIRMKASKNSSSKSYYTYKASTLFLHMISLPRNTLTPLKYAAQVIDPLYGTQFAQFITLYLKQKYAGQELTQAEVTTKRSNNFIQPFEHKSKRNRIPLWQRILCDFKNLNHFVRYFILPEESEINDSNIYIKLFNLTYYGIS